ncbi:hypothetical protein ABG768_013259 [Culter alburnus]|uniref:Uncharacterized protein n=1 Tax=Culter alburnus TaxID=194366 RepID=A0AAW2B1G4_CULAL
MPPVAPYRQNTSRALPHQRPFCHSSLQLNFRVQGALISRLLLKTKTCAHYPNVLAQPASGAKYQLEGLTLPSPSVVILCSFAWIDEGPTPTQINEDSEALPEERSAYAAVSLWTTIGADHNHQR